MSDEFLDYVEDIIDALEKAEIATATVEYDQFAADFMINFVVKKEIPKVKPLVQQILTDYES